MPVKKTTAKVAAETTVAAKTTPVKTEEVKTETTVKAAPAKKAPVRRGAAKKEAAAKKAPAAKVTPVKEAPEAAKETVYVQFAGAEYNLDDIRANVKKAWAAETGKSESDIKDVQIYVKPEEKAAYYVVNGEFSEDGRKIEL